MGNAGTLGGTEQIQFEWCIAWLVEQPNTLSKQNGHQVKVKLIDQPRPETLL